MPKRKRQGSRAPKSRARSKKPAARAKVAAARNTTAEDKSLREHLLYLLRGGGAHLDFEKAIAGLPAELRGAKPAGLAFSAWGLLEHMRIAQWDILEFSRDPKHVSPSWPEGYWPSSDAPPSSEAWDRSVAAFRADRRAMEQLIGGSKTDLHVKIPHGEGQTILREALLVADHNAYHLGQLVMLRRFLGAWSE
jgi:DinB superfamily